METVSFPENSRCRTIPLQAFAECRQLKQLVLPDTLEVIEDEAFYKCDSLTSVQLPRLLLKIGDKSFYQCGLETLNLPESLRFIGDSAFLKCKNLRYVRIPRTVEHLGKWAFHGCSRLEVLEIHHDPAEIGEWITNKNCTIRCPKGSRMEEYAVKYEMQVEYL